MRILTLQIKKAYLDDILSGKKKNEYREIRPKNAKKYVIQDPEAQNEDDYLNPVHYNAIQFFNGYAKNRPEALVKIEKAMIEILEDEDGNEIVYEENGAEYVMAQMNYSLGDIISRKNV